MARKSTTNTRLVKNKSGSTSLRTKNNCTGKWSSKVICNKKKK